MDKKQIVLVTTTKQQIYSMDDDKEVQERFLLH